MTFESMDMPVVLKSGLEKLKLVKPTPIQEKAIPIAIGGSDVLGSAQTGSGKTIAFLLPLLTHLLKKDNKSKKAMIITPTRELAQQVMVQTQALMKGGVFLPTALLIGGDSMFKQLKQLKASPKIIIGTPGRINDHLRRNSLDLKQCDFVVLDETDRMLDMGFSIQIEAILKKVSVSRQTLMFSATFPDEIKKISNKHLTDPVNVTIDSQFLPAKEITQETIMIPEKEKNNKLLEFLENKKGSVVMFMKTKHSTERMAKKLSQSGYQSDAIHGDLRQSRRSKVIESFRKEKFRVLVATDVAARGLDIPHLENVINYDMPQCPEDYIHRIGRTGRNGASGFAMNFVSPADKRLWQAIGILLDPSLKPAKSQNQRRGKKFGSQDRNQKESSRANRQLDSKRVGSKNGGKFYDNIDRTSRKKVSSESSKNMHANKRRFVNAGENFSKNNGNSLQRSHNQINTRQKIFLDDQDAAGKKHINPAFLNEERVKSRSHKSFKNSRSANFDTFSKGSFKQRDASGNGQESRRHNAHSKSGLISSERENAFGSGHKSGLKSHGNFKSGERFQARGEKNKSSDGFDSRKKRDGSFDKKRFSKDGFKAKDSSVGFKKRSVSKGKPIYIKMPEKSSLKYKKKEQESCQAV